MHNLHYINLKNKINSGIKLKKKTLYFFSVTKHNFRDIDSFILIIGLYFFFC